jgi:CRISPR/Cas system-associated protein Csm6
MFLNTNSIFFNKQKIVCYVTRSKNEVLCAEVVGSLPAEQNELRITNTGSLKSMGTTKYFQNGLAQLVESFIKNYRIM